LRRLSKILKRSKQRLLLHLRRLEPRFLLSLTHQKNQRRIHLTHLGMDQERKRRIPPSSRLLSLRLRKRKLRDRLFLMPERQLRKLIQRTHSSKSQRRPKKLLRLRPRPVWLLLLLRMRSSRNSKKNSSRRRRDKLLLEIRPSHRMLSFGPPICQSTSSRDTSRPKLMISDSNSPSSRIAIATHLPLTPMMNEKEHENEV